MSVTGIGDIHRIGGGSIENLRLKPREETLTPPGISVLKAASPEEVVHQVYAALPKAKKLHEMARTVGSTTEGLIRSTGFDIVPVPSRTFPNHHRIVHPEGVEGFNDENLARLASAFVNTTGY